MLSSMEVHSIQYRATFVLTIRIQNLVCTISGPFRRAPYRWPNEGLHTLGLGVFFGAIHDSAERYPPPNCHPDTRKVVRQINLDWIHNKNSSSFFFWLYRPAGAGKTAILQAIAEYLCSPSGAGQNFGGSFFFSREEWSRSRPFSVLNNRISTCSGSTWTTSTRQSYRGIEFITSYKVNGRAATKPYCRCVSIIITTSTMFLSWYHRRIGWMPWVTHDKAIQSSIYPYLEEPEFRAEF